MSSSKDRAGLAAQGPIAQVALNAPSSFRGKPVPAKSLPGYSRFQPAIHRSFLAINCGAISRVTERTLRPRGSFTGATGTKIV